MLLPDPIPPYKKAKTCPGVVGNGAESVAFVKKWVRMNRNQTSASAKALWRVTISLKQARKSRYQVDCRSFNSCVGQPHRDTESPTSCYQQYVKALRVCRKALYARRRERSQAEATCHKPDLTLQHITGNSMYGSKFGRKYQQASRAVFEKTVRDLCKACAPETKLVKASCISMFQGRTTNANFLSMDRKE